MVPAGAALAGWHRSDHQHAQASLFHGTSDLQRGLWISALRGLVRNYEEFGINCPRSGATKRPMSKKLTDRRRKLLREIQHLADTAIFGTLSESYRTCGRAGCHCQGQAPSTVLIFMSAIAATRARPQATTCRKLPSRPCGKGWLPGNDCSNA